ncbi:hypothetical protein RvVAR0630_09950 [Agrobacterium vitis]|uniref:AAA family ATPase n=1 Tax=Agrobacterium vitis TaxID=373 RepID=UPI0015D95EBF|nr:AAA family ATPase [Agrobacterium vitis]BCH58371.1 hypothetical protein RvVAR0630_09950 [Agrobacterium vitis]
MKIKKLTLTNFRRFRNFEIDFHEQITVLVARNGAGKTSVLDAIALGLGSFLTRLPLVSGINPDKASDLLVPESGPKPPYMRIRCETFDGIVWDRTEKRDQSRGTLRDIPEAQGLSQLHKLADKFIDAENSENPYELPIIAYYGTGRGVFDIPKRKKGFGKVFPRFQAYKSALEARANFRQLVEYFYFLSDQETQLQREARSFDVQAPELEAVRRAVYAMLPSFSNLEKALPAGIKVDWKHDGESKELRIEQLSDGFRTTIAMVMDIAVRMAEANPQMPDPLFAQGIVLIDEVDLHLHPGWQQHVLLDLMRVFPKIQFIVTTHSPQVVSSVKPECVRVIDWQDGEAFVRPIQFSEGAEAQQVLLDVLDVRSPRATDLEIVKKLGKYQELVAQNLWDTPEAVDLRRELDKWGAQKEPELRRLDIDIRLKTLGRRNETNK